MDSLFRCAQNKINPVLEWSTQIIQMHITQLIVSADL